MAHSFCNIKESAEFVKAAANILFSTFSAINKGAWPTEEEASDTVRECIAAPNICIGILIDKTLIGWAGLRPMYPVTWELHPLVIAKEYQGKGYGKLLINRLEEEAKMAGIIGIVLGTDDETNSTSLSACGLTGENIFSEISNIRNRKNHPYEFYKKCGYSIIGAIPNANGINKLDIWMWKDINGGSNVIRGNNVICGNTIPER
ncbi:aminoglycoside N-acetyltransferase AAC(6')-Ii [Spirochaetia bacterium]|nr:aminoglycoside N-acetyltransferase AAC(6')-Ii [Spirochaetia bacterium]